MGGNSKTESARVVFLVHHTPTQCPLHIGEVSWKYLKGFQSYGPHKILQFWETMGDNSWIKSMSFLHMTLLPNALYNLTKFHENSSKGIGVMGHTRFRLQTDGQTDGQTDARAIAISPEPIRQGIKIIGIFFFIELRFYCPVNLLGSCRAQSVYLATVFLDMVSPLSG